MDNFHSFTPILFVMLYVLKLCYLLSFIMLFIKLEIRKQASDFAYFMKKFQIIKDHNFLITGVAL